MASPDIPPHFIFTIIVCFLRECNDRKHFFTSVFRILGTAPLRYGVAHGLAMAVLLPHVMRQFGASAHKRLAELADVCGIDGANEAEKANAFIRWIEETNARMGLPDKFDIIREKDIDQMITWAKKEANPLYPVPVVWGRKDFRRLIESIRK